MKTSNLLLRNPIIDLLSVSVLAILVSLFIYALPVQAQSEGTITIDTTPDEGPVISFIHNNTSLRAVATDTNLDESTWQNAGPFVNEPNCSASYLSYSAAGATAHAVILDESDNGHWYCFKVLDFDQNVGQASFLVRDVVELEPEPEPEPEPAPEEPMPVVVTIKEATVEVVQSGNRVSATTDIEEPQWQAVIVLNASDCRAGAFNNDFTLALDSVGDLNGHSNGLYYCFQASNDTHEGYGYIRVKGLPPVVADTPETPAPIPAPVEGGNEDTNDKKEDPQSETSETGETDKEETEDNSELLRYISIGIVVLGLAGILAIVLSKRRPDSDLKDGDEDENF